MKKFVCVLVFASLGMGASAQTDSARMSVKTLNELENVQSSGTIPVFQYWREHDIFQHLDVSLTLGARVLVLMWLRLSPIGLKFVLAMSLCRGLRSPWALT